MFCIWVQKVLSSFSSWSNNLTRFTFFMIFIHLFIFTLVSDKILWLVIAHKNTSSSHQNCWDDQPTSYVSKYNCPIMKMVHSYAILPSSGYGHKLQTQYPTTFFLFNVFFFSFPKSKPTPKCKMPIHSVWKKKQKKKDLASSVSHLAIFHPFWF